jgi:hypothetical protein
MKYKPYEAIITMTILIRFSFLFAGKRMSVNARNLTFEGAKAEMGNGGTSTFP